MGNDLTVNLYYWPTHIVFPPLRVIELTMHATTVLIAALCFQMAATNVIDTPDDGQPNARPLEWTNGTAEAETDPDEEYLKKLRIQTVKFQILSKLNLKEAPPSVESPSETSREMIRLLMKEDEERRQRQYGILDSEERLLIHARGSGMTCIRSNESYCKMFRYEVNASLNTSAMDIWIYKMTAKPRRLSILLSFSNSFEEKDYHTLNYDLHQAGWNKIQLPRIFLPPSWNDSISYSVEINAYNVDYHGDHRPFLMVSKLFFMPSRQRRDINCDTNESCCLKPLRVSFAEIGFNWVLLPLELEANMCTGKCTVDHGAHGTNYERVVSKVLESDTALQETLGKCWPLSCKPKILEPVRVIYKDTDGIFHEHNIPELTVKSCSCS